MLVYYITPIKSYYYKSKLRTKKWSIKYTIPKLYARSSLTTFISKTFWKPNLDFAEPPRI